MSERRRPPYEKQYPVELIQTPGHARVATALVTTPFDKDAVLAEYYELSRQNRVARSITQGGRRGTAAEIHVQQVLRGLDGVEPIVPKRVKTGQYDFKVRGYGSVDVISSNIQGRPRESATEIDALVLIDGVITVVEIKMSVDQARSTSQLSLPLWPDNMRKRFKPIKNLVREHKVPYQLDNIFAYMYVLPRDVVPRNDPDMTRFVREGGMLVNLPFTAAELDGEIEGLFPFSGGQ